MIMTFNTEALSSKGRKNMEMDITPQLVCRILPSGSGGGEQTARMSREIRRYQKP